MAELKPCPKCGGGVIGLGMPIKITTPKVFRPLMRRIGRITCIRCGYYCYSRKLWNRRAEDVK